MDALDFILDEDGDLQITGGDFVVDLSDTQHVEDILISAPGTWRQSPTIGVDIINELNAPNGGEDVNRIRKIISINMELDGLTIAEMNLKSLEDFEVKAERK